LQTFKREVASILTTLSGSPWATHPGVQKVLTEYGHLAEAARTPHATRRISLQIFHASRAIDSLLAQIAGNEAAKPGTANHTKPFWTLGSSLHYIEHHSIGGRKFIPATKTDLDLLTIDRNTYLHGADVFPTDVQMRLFLTRTVKALQEAITFPM
jgi:hypothetical protein